MQIISNVNIHVANGRGCYKVCVRNQGTIVYFICSRCETARNIVHSAGT